MDFNDPLGKMGERDQKTFNFFTSSFFPENVVVCDSFWLIFYCCFFLQYKPAFCRVGKVQENTEMLI